MTTSTDLYVIGGRQRTDRSLRDLETGWYGYGTGVILRVGASGVETVVEYVSPPGTCGPEDPVLFKSATRHGDRLFCTTQTEIVVFAIPTFEIVRHVSLPCFNDVHHVVPTERDTLLIANSGLENVLEVDESDRVVSEWNVLGEDTWAGRDRDVDFRIGVDTKPHRGHPNHLVIDGTDVWVNRFELRDVVKVGDLSSRVEIGSERIHDGDVHDGLTWFTTVDGTVVGVDLSLRRVIERHRLGRSGDDDQTLGWCRGLLFEHDRCWVGFSRIRPTRLRHTVSWIRARGTPTAPTRLACYDTADWTLVDEIDLEAYGLNAIFSIVAA